MVNVNKRIEVSFISEVLKKKRGSKYLAIKQSSGMLIKRTFKDELRAKKKRVPPYNGSSPST